MPITDEINKHLRKLSRENKYGEIVSYVSEKLEESVFSAQEIFDYANKSSFSTKPNKTYVINANAINMIGVVVGTLENKAQAKLKVKFYKLAAERNSSCGNRNYAQILLNGDKTKEQALAFVKKAVELAQGEEINEHEYKFILCKALRVHNQWVEANAALMEYFKFKSTNKEAQEKISQVFILFKQIMGEFQNDFTEKKKKNLTAVRWKANLAELVPFLEVQSWQVPAQYKEQYQAIQQEAYYIKAKCHEELGENSEALLAYCKVTDRALVFYVEAIDARARLLKEQIASDLALKPSPAVDAELVTATATVSADAQHTDVQDIADSKTDKEEKTKEPSTDAKAAGATMSVNSKLSPVDRLAIAQSDLGDSRYITERKLEEVLVLPGGIPFPVQFSTAWKAEASWLHSVDTDGMKKEFDKRSVQLDQLVTAKQTEIELIKDTQKNTAAEAKTNETLLKRKEVLEGELAELNKIKEKLDQKYKKYSYEDRQVFRRHAAERHFFDPRRSRKAAEISTLASEIIDQRYNPGTTARKSVALTKKSVRLFISSERVFQQAVVTLTDEKNPTLGIPTARAKGWQTDYSSGATGYGPVELYQVGDTKIESEHRTEPKRQRLGDSFLPQHSTYNNIYFFLCRLAQDNKKKEQQLTKFMLRYGRDHQSVTLAELQTIYDKADKSDVDEFTRVCFLVMEKEQVQWHSATQEDYQLGMSVAQARCLIMLEAGYISMKEAFKNNTLFGVYSQTGIMQDPEKVAKACKHIDMLYIAYLQTKRSREYLTFFKKHIRSTTLSTLLTREQAHRDLQYVYGGDSDTDDEAYETDLDIPQSDNKKKRGWRKDEDQDSDDDSPSPKRRKIGKKGEGTVADDKAASPKPPAAADNQNNDNKQKLIM
jgi:hypothetical protein